jgi:hypothetical protein
MRGWLPALFALAAACTCACGCDASGGEQGGQPIAADPCGSPQLGHTWTDLYTCYFGPTGKANCSAQSACHATLGYSGGIPGGGAVSGFTCNADKHACWFSMTHPLYALQGVEPPTACDAGAAAADGSCPAPMDDAGPDAAPTCGCYPSSYLPLVPTGGTSDPSGAKLWSYLYGASPDCTGPVCNNMPCANLGQNCPKGTGAYAFTADDLARISAWIKEGAQDN